MSTDLVMSIINKEEANKLADLIENNNGEYFQKKYGLLWPMKFASFAIAAFVRARIRELGMWGYAMEDVKKKCDVKYIREMFDLNEFPDFLWLGDATTEMLINTYLLAFLHDGKHVDYDDNDVDDVNGGLEPIEGYKIISGDYAKFHSKYKGWELYRAWNISEDHGKMRYFAVKDDEIREAKNLSGIKHVASR